MLEFRAAPDDDTSHSRLASMGLLNGADEQSGILFWAEGRDENRQVSVASHGKLRSHRRRRFRGHDLGNAVRDYPNSIPPVAELQESRNLPLADGDRAIHPRPHYSCQNLSMPSPRGPRPEVEVLRRDVRRADFSRDQMTDDMSVDAVRHNNGGSQLMQAQRSAETDDVQPVAH